MSFLPFNYGIRCFNSPQSCLSSFLTLVVNKATMVRISCLVLSDMKSSYVTVWWDIPACYPGRNCFSSFYLIWNRYSAYDVAEVPHNSSGGDVSILFKYLIRDIFFVYFYKNIGPSPNIHVLFHGTLSTSCHRLMIGIVKFLWFITGTCVTPFNNWCDI